MKLPILYIDRVSFDNLPEYSATYPTGTQAGKRWKRHDGVFDRDFVASGGTPSWMIGEYGDACDRNGNPDPKGSFVGIRWYRPIIVEPQHIGTWLRGKGGVSWHLVRKSAAND